MFARVSTYRPAPDSTGEPSEETVQQVLGLPGCRGIYYLLGKENTSLSLTLWDDDEALAGSRQTAERIRKETTTEQHMEILGVDEFEVLTHQLRE
jgi:heme-degrading monooxygenase HmoA